ncbi:MAG: Gfo/Idh/MocA family oxidoreductase [Planctomycetes bacterium]|nr:Gfo/Idh/MocA family oxidoreductase [Planctomycetota bacterium]
MNRTALNQSWPRPTRPQPIVFLGGGGIVNDAHIPAYRKLRLPLAGVYDPDQARARATAERWKLPRVFTSLDEALAQRGVVFDVAVPPAELVALVKRLPRGSAALLQKPMGRNLAEAKQIRAACRSRRITAAVNFQLRYSPMMLAIRDAIARGLLGRVIEVEMHLNYETPWQLWPFLQKLDRVEILVHSIHYLDWFRSVLGDPTGVYARTVKHPAHPKLASSRTTAILDYGDDIRCAMSVNHAHVFGPRHQCATVRVEGTRGAAVGSLGVNMNYPRGEPDWLEINTGGHKWKRVPLKGSWFPDAFKGTMSNLQRFVAGEDRVLHTAVEDAYRTMALVEACHESDAHGATPIPR